MPRRLRALASRIVSALVATAVVTAPLAGAVGVSSAAAAVGVVSHVASLSAASTGTSRSVRVPAAVEAGDTLLLFLTTNSTVGTVGSPSGWRLLRSPEGSGIRGRAWTKQASSTDASTPPNVTVTSSAAVKSVITMAAYRSSLGPSSVTASSSAVVNTSASSHSAPAVAVSTAGSWLVSDWSVKASAAVTFSTPAGTVSRAKAQGTGSGLIAGVVADSNAPLAAGTAAARRATTSRAVSRSVDFSVVVAPGSGVANTAPVARFTSSCPALSCTFNASTSTDANGDALSYSWAFGDGTSATGVSPAHTYTTGGSKTVVLTVSDGTTTSRLSQQAAPKAPVGPGTQPVPGHTRLAPQTPRTNLPQITTGEIWDYEVVGTKVYVAGGFTGGRNNAAGNTATVNQADLMKFDMTTGLIDTTFRPAFGGGGVQDVEASPDGTKLFVAGRFTTINGVTKRKFASIDPGTGAPVAGFTADANGAGTELEATNTTAYLGGQYTTINGTPKGALAAVDSSTGALVGRTSANPGGTFTNNITGGIGPNGALNVQELKLTHDSSKLLVVHTGRQVDGQNRYGVALISTATLQLLPWRSRLWEDNLANVGGIQRIYGGDIAPDDSYAVVTSGSGGDAPPISDTVVSLPLTDTGNGDVQENWVSRAFDSVYSVAATEKGVYIGGHFSWNESPTARDPWPGLTNVGYGTGQGLSGYGLGDEVVRRDHIGALDPATGKAIEWSPGSNSFEGNKAMMATARGVIAGGDATTQGGYNVGRVAFYDFDTQTLNTPNDTTITTPIEGRVEQAAVPFTVEGTAKAASGVRRVQLEVSEGSRYLQDDLTTWGAANTIDVTLAEPGATSTGWSLPLTVAGNRALTLQAKTFAADGSNDGTKAVKHIETFSTADKAPTATISAPSSNAPVASTTFTVSGTATDDFGVASLGWTMRDVNNRYLQDDGSAGSTYNSFRLTPDVVGAASTTWSFEVTVPSEGQWQLQVTPTDTSGQSALDTTDRTWIVSSTGIAPSVDIARPVVMTPPTAANPMTVTPGSPMTFSGRATDDQNLDSVEVTLRNTTTRENLASDGTWGTDVQAGQFRVSPLNLNATTYSWSYTTPFNLKAGSYTFTVRATDDVGLVTSSTNQGRLTVNAQVADDLPPDGRLGTTGTVTGLQSLHLDLAGTATDDIGVAGVLVSLQDRDSNRYLQPNGTMASGFATLAGSLASPGATSTTWTLPVDLPTQGSWSVTAYAVDTSGQQDTSTTGATASYPIYPGDQAPTVTQNLLAPTNGMVFTDGRIFISGRVEDDQAIARAEVAVVNSAGQYLSSAGTFGTTTTESWIRAFLNSPGSAGSNYSYTTQVVPAGSYTVRVRGVDQHGFVTAPTTDVTVTVQVPASDPPVAGFSVVCGPALGAGATTNVCELDGRSSTDENPTGLSFAWSFGTTPASTGTGAVVRKTYTSAAAYTVSLTVRDEYGNLSTPATRTVTIAEPAGNTAPTAKISDPSCTGLACNFSSAASTDPDVGDTLTRVWSWGDGTSDSTTTSLAHTFPAAGIYPVTLTVTDGWGRSTTVSRQVMVSG